MNVKLHNNINMPDICYGTGIALNYRYKGYTFLDALKYYLLNVLKYRKRIRADIKLPKAIKCALKSGYKCFDTSRAYGGAEYVLGKKIKKYNRADLFIVTKLSNKDQLNNNVKDAFETSLKELGTDYIDLYLMHWPVEGKYLDNWKEMEKLYKAGLCKAIGVCNCNIHHLEKIKEIAEIMPMVNEIECHPLFTQNELRQYCQNNGIQVMAYTSTARMDERFKNTTLAQIAKKYNKTQTQIILKWHQQVGNVPIVNSLNCKHVIDNIEISDFELSDDEVKEISGYNINSRLRYDPDNCDFTKL